MDNLGFSMGAEESSLAQKIAILKFICEHHPEDIDLKFICELFGWPMYTVNAHYMASDPAWNPQSVALKRRWSTKKLDDKLISSIKHDYIFGHLSKTQIARKYGVNIHTVMKYLKDEEMKDTNIVDNKIITEAKKMEVISHYKRSGPVFNVISLKTGLNVEDVRDIILEYDKENEETNG